MNQLIDVATWVGLFAGVVGMALAVVAIWFTFSTDARSRRVSEQMIRSLQKIETSVERSSADTQGLIKVAWDRMLGDSRQSVGSPDQSDSEPDSANNQIAAGLAEEVRSELSDKNGALDEDRLVQRITEAIQAQLRAGQSSGGRISDRVDYWLRTITHLSPPALALAQIMAKDGHLNRSQYRSLSAANSTYARAIRELRTKGVITALAGEGEPRSQQPVYWFSPNDSRFIATALSLVPEVAGPRKDQLIKDLERVGYLISERNRKGPPEVNGNNLESGNSN